MKSLPMGGCSPMSILIAIVIAGIILVMVASVNNSTTSTGSPTVTSVFVSPLALPAGNVAPSGLTVSGQSVVNTDGSTSADSTQCASGCMLDNMCGTSQSIIARVDPDSSARYFYTPDHPAYETFRTAETQGQVNYYFCTADQAEAQGWRPAP